MALRHKHQQLLNNLLYLSAVLLYFYLFLKDALPKSGEFPIKQAPSETSNNLFWKFIESLESFVDEVKTALFKSRLEPGSNQNLDILLKTLAKATNPRRETNLSTPTKEKVTPVSN